MVHAWADTIVKLNISKDEYVLPKNVIKDNLSKKMVHIYENISAKRTLALSEHFAVGEDVINSLLLCEGVSNVFEGNPISSAKINIASGIDKLAIARSYVRKYKAKNMGIIIDDYDDLKLLELQPKFIVAHKRLRRFCKADTYFV